MVAAGEVDDTASVDAVAAVLDAHPRGGGPDGDWARRVGQLLEAQRSLVQDLSLTDVLSRIVSAAQTVSGARYAALGVLGSNGDLDQFVHIGLTPQEIARIGDLPRGRGVLGALIDDPRTIRMDRLGDDPRSSGFPAHHPAMTNFLGVPVRSHREVFGNLYLTDRAGGPFTDDDEMLVTALAAMAGTAVANARLYERARRRQDWLSASAAISRRLLATDAPQSEVLQSIADTVLRIAEADLVSIVRPVDSGDLQVEVESGDADHRLVDYRYPAAGSLAQRAMSTGHGMIVERVTEDADEAHRWVHLSTVIPVGSAMVFPLLGEHGSRGAIVVGRVRGRPPFAGEWLPMAETFAHQAAVAMELAEARAARHQLQVLDDRDRIARDLHDHVIQRIFASGLTLQGLAYGQSDPVVGDRLTEVVDDLDAIIRQIRSTIFELRDPEDDLGLRRAVLDVVAAAHGLPTPARITFVGPVDTVGADLVGDVTAVVREGLTNVVRHAGARSVEVIVEATGPTLILLVRDDGVGWPDSVRRSGLANLTTRAERRGGSVALEATPGGGATVRWTIPIR